eukprot:gene10484-7454_t
MGLGYSSYGMGMGMPMGMAFNPLMMGPMAFLTNINYMVMSVGQVISNLKFWSGVLLCDNGFKESAKSLEHFALLL